jgi:hypothetical protein
MGLAAPAHAAAERIASPQGTGSACTLTQPCSLPVAVGGARPGDTVLLLSGAYGRQELAGPGGTSSARIVVGPMDGASPVLGTIRSAVPYVDWRGIAVQGSFLLNAGSDGSTFRNMRVSGGGLFVRAKNIVVEDSLFAGGSSVDGIQVGRASGVLIQRNIVRDYDQTIDNGLHADCLQIFDSSHVTVRANSLSNCHNAGIIISPGSGAGITDLLIESNFIQGCVVRSERCVGGSAIDLRESSARGVVARNNTIVDGATRIPASAGVVFDRNIVSYLADCGSRLTNSVVMDWNKKLCAQPSVLSGSGNRVAQVAFVDRAAGDLHLGEVAGARITPTGGTAAATDRDGHAVDPTIAGADTPRDGDLPPPGTVPSPTPPTTPPTGPTPGEPPAGGASCSVWDAASKFLATLPADDVASLELTDDAGRSLAVVTGTLSDWNVDVVGQRSGTVSGTLTAYDVDRRALGNIPVTLCL